MYSVAYSVALDYTEITPERSIHRSKFSDRVVQIRRVVDHLLFSSMFGVAVHKDKKYLTIITRLPERHTSSPSFVHVR